eukprot:TRINITY_DN4900_c1_g3_i1.p3 TRINITY_DN4900_c1_g3~~TRINITY_DN4900_c1_g3_i1.p3  ORF type:complete len:133 (+),score=15.93 TRINITY_DN4900_c1_g3_i1:3-401(+)
MHSQTQRVAPPHMPPTHTGYHYYQQWPTVPQYPPPMGPPMQPSPPVNAGPYVQSMGSQVQPQMQMMGRSGGMYVTSPMQGSHPPQPTHQMEGYLGGPLPPPAPPQQLSMGQFPTNQMGGGWVSLMGGAYCTY